MKPQCSNCNNSGCLDGGLCALCFKEKYGKWSKQFTVPVDKLGKKKIGDMKFKKKVKKSK